jgi:hypothetical protein
VQKDSCFELGQVRYVLQSPQKCSCVDTARNQKKVIGTVSVRVFDVCATKLHIYHEQCVRRYRLCMTTKSPTLNISAFVPSSVRGFEKPGQTRFPCVFVALLRCAHTLTCIFNFTYPLTVPCQRCGLLSSMHCATMAKISQKILRHALISKIHGLVFTTRVEDEFLCSCTCTYILAFLTVKTQPLSCLDYAPPIHWVKSFTYFATYNGIGRECNVIVCVLGSDLMCCQHILMSNSWPSLCPSCDQSLLPCWKVWTWRHV